MTNVEEIKGAHNGYQIIFPVVENELSGYRKFYLDGGVFIFRLLLIHFPSKENFFYTIYGN